MGNKTISVVSNEYHGACGNNTSGHAKKENYGKAHENREEYDSFGKPANAIGILRL
jgi:hypothetical protein